MNGETVVEFINCSRSEITRRGKIITPDLVAAKTQEVRQKEQKGQSGCAQVTAVHDKLSYTSDLAGASPHAPQPPRRSKPARKGTKNSLLCLRVKSEIKDLIKQRAEVVGSYPTAYALEILAAGLGLPIDEYTRARNKGLKEAYFKNSVALDRVGTLLNQVAAAAHKFQPCPITRPEIERMLSDHAAACKAHLRMGHS